MSHYYITIMKNKLNILAGMGILGATALCLAFSYPIITLASDDASASFSSDSSTNLNQDAVPAAIIPSPVTPDPSTTLNQDSTGSFTSDPSTNLNQDAAGSFSSDPSTNLNQDSSGSTVPPATPPSNGGGSSSSSGGSSVSGSGSSGSGSFLGGSGSSGGFVPLAFVASSATTSCPLITSYLQFGADNDGSQVAKLQAFLKDSQGLDVAVTGTFDQKTEDAVKAFQVKYLPDVMGPWGATQGSGFVYITTSKKINELACNAPLTLTPGETAIINAYKNAEANGQNGTSTVGPAVPGTLNATGTPLIGVAPGNSANNQANTASVVNASILQRLWSFIKGLF